MEFIRNDMTISESHEYDSAQPTPAPVFTEEDLRPEEPDQPTLEPTEEPTVEPTPTPEPTPEPTAEPTAEPTTEPTAEPTAEPTQEPTAVPTAEPTAEPTPGPTQEPYQRIGHAVTIGDGVFVRNWPGITSVIIDSLPANKIVYVTGQEYVDGTAWHITQYDGNWGYIRADMLRMMTPQEERAYLEEATATEPPEPEITLAPFDSNAMSCYGYVSADSVNFRSSPNMNNADNRIGQLKKYALCIIYDSTEVNGTRWYKVNYNGTTGYVNGDYFRQMTVSEAESFFSSPQYLEGINNNNPSKTTTAPSGPATTGTPGGIVSAEDQQVSIWTNPDSDVHVSYEPFDPFATPAPLPENMNDETPENVEYLDSLVERIQNGSLKEEDLEKTLGIAYQDNANKDETIAKAMEYIQGKIHGEGTEPTGTGEAEPTDNPLETQNNPPEPVKADDGLPIWAWGLIVVGLAGAAGGGYAIYASKVKKRAAAQRMAQKRAAAQRSQKQAAGNQGRTQTPPPPSAQQAARVRTGTYTEKGGYTQPKPASDTQQAGKPYSRNVENPYGRYTTSGDKGDSSYTASFKPEENPNQGSARRRNNQGDRSDQG